jgi:glycosyltransferase involved in cell wall biosynthesis
MKRKDRPISQDLRVLAVTNSYPTKDMPGDVPCIRDQINALKNAGIDVELLHILRSPKVNYLKALFKIIGLSFGRRRFDFIHAYYGHCVFLARFQFKYPIIATFRGSDLLHGKDGYIGRFAARFVNKVIVMSEEMKVRSKRRDAHIIPFGINTEVFMYRDMIESRNELDLPKDNKLILFPWDPSRAEKRFDLVKSASQILQRDNMQIELVVIYDEPQEVVAKYMNACDVMVLTSDHEGSPLTIREALACGLPVVSVDVGDIRKTIENVDGCYMCKKKAEDIAEKISKVLINGRRLYSTDLYSSLDAQSSAQRVIQVYQEALGMISHHSS